MSETYQPCLRETYFLLKKIENEVWFNCTFWYKRGDGAPPMYVYVTDQIESQINSFRFKLSSLWRDKSQWDDYVSGVRSYLKNVVPSFVCWFSSGRVSYKVDVDLILNNYFLDSLDEDGFSIDIPTRNAMLSQTYIIKNDSGERVRLNLQDVMNIAGKWIMTTEYPTNTIEEAISLGIQKQSKSSGAVTSWGKARKQFSLNHSSIKNEIYKKQKKTEKINSEYVWFPSANGFIYELMDGDLKQFSKNNKFVYLPLYSFNDINIEKDTCIKREIPTIQGFQGVDVKYIYIEGVGVNVVQRDAVDGLKITADPILQFSWATDGVQNISVIHDVSVLKVGHEDGLSSYSIEDGHLCLNYEDSEKVKFTMSELNEMIKDASITYDNYLRQGKTLDYILNYIFDSDIVKIIGHPFMKFKAKGYGYSKIATEIMKTKPTYIVSSMKKKKISGWSKCRMTIGDVEVKGEVLCHGGLDINLSSEHNLEITSFQKHSSPFDYNPDLSVYSYTMYVKSDEDHSMPIVLIKNRSVECPMPWNIF